ncbi:hypothetical protein [Streptomyces sp. NPDC001056]
MRAVRTIAVGEELRGEVDDRAGDAPPAVSGPAAEAVAALADGAA